MSYLPELRSHLDRLLADRERVIAATELEPWAQTEATPSDAEIQKVRALIRRLDDHVDDLSPSERHQITEAIGVLRTTRHAVVHLGMPIAPPNGRDPRDVRAAGR